MLTLKLKTRFADAWDPLNGILFAYLPAGPVKLPKAVDVPGRSGAFTCTDVPIDTGLEITADQDLRGWFIGKTPLTEGPLYVTLRNVATQDDSKVSHGDTIGRFTFHPKLCFDVDGRILDGGMALL